MNSKALLTTLAFLAFAGFSIWWWNNKRKDCNCGAPVAATTTAGNSENSNSLPLYTNWNNAAAVKGSGFDNYRKEQLKNLGPTDTLVIKTWYWDGEQNGIQLARQRADSIKALFPDVDASRIRILTEMRTATGNEKTGFFSAAEFSILQNQNSLVKKAGNKVTIYFASNSSAKNLEKEIDTYLNSLVAEMKSNPNETVTATGYTDNVGDDAKNLTLSKGRADFVKTILAGKGADATKINTVGKGEAEPIAGNDSEAGRKQNRRVELIINNQ